MRNGRNVGVVEKNKTLLVTYIFTKCVKSLLQSLLKILTRLVNAISSFMKNWVQKWVVIRHPLHGIKAHSQWWIAFLITHDGCLSLSFIHFINSYSRRSLFICICMYTQICVNVCLCVCVCVRKERNIYIYQSQDTQDILLWVSFSISFPCLSFGSHRIRNAFVYTQQTLVLSHLKKTVFLLKTIKWTNYFIYEAKCRHSRLLSLIVRNSF